MKYTPWRIQLDSVGDFVIEHPNWEFELDKRPEHDLLQSLRTLHIYEKCFTSGEMNMLEFLMDELQEGITSKEYYNINLEVANIQRHWGNIVYNKLGEQDEI